MCNNHSNAEKQFSFDGSIYICTLILSAENSDNSFLGFSVDSDVIPGREIEKDNVGLIYGRSPDGLKVAFNH